MLNIDLTIVSILPSSEHLNDSVTVRKTEKIVEEAMFAEDVFINLVSVEVFGFFLKIEINFHSIGLLLA